MGYIIWCRGLGLLSLGYKSPPLFPRIFGAAAGAGAGAWLRVELTFVAVSGWRHGHASSTSYSHAHMAAAAAECARTPINTHISQKICDIGIIRWSHGSAWTAHGQRWAPCTGHRCRRTAHVHARIRTRTASAPHTASAPRSMSICEKVSRPR